jgi:integrase
MTASLSGAGIPGSYSPRGTAPEATCAEGKERKRDTLGSEEREAVRKAKRKMFEDFAKEYEEKTVLHYMPNSRDRNVAVFRVLTRFFGRCRLDEIDTDLVESFRRSRHAEGVKPATINRDHALLRRMLNVAADWGLLPQRPLLRVKGLKEAPREFRPPQGEELEKLLAACATSRNKDLKDLAMTALFTGMRRGEILHLQWGDIDFVRNEVRVVSRESHQTKNNRSRSVPLHARLKETLQKRKRREDSEYVFPGPDGKPLGDIKHGWDTARKKAGMAKFRFHDLRHTFASFLVMNNEDLRTVQDLMGHQSLTMVQRYSHLSPEHRQGAIQRLDFGDGVRETPEPARPRAMIFQLRRRTKAAR